MSFGVFFSADIHIERGCGNIYGFCILAIGLGLVEERYGYLRVFCKCQLLPSWCQRMMGWLYALLLEGNAYRFWYVVQVWSLHDLYCVGTGVFLLEKSFAKALSLDCETCNAELLTCLDGSQGLILKAEAESRDFPENQTISPWAESRVFS